MRRVAGDTPFEHVVVDLQAEHGPRNVLVIANETVLGAPLLDRIRERHKAGDAEFLTISPQGESEGSYEEAERRLRRAVLDEADGARHRAHAARAHALGQGANVVQRTIPFRPSSSRAMTRRWTSLVPSPMVPSLLSRR